MLAALKVKSAVCLSVFLVGLAGCSHPPSGDMDKSNSVSKKSPVAEAEVTNPSRFVRSDQALYFSFYDLGIHEGQKLDIFAKGANGELALPSQTVDIDGNGTSDGILALLTMEPGESQELVFKPSEGASPVTKKRTQAEVAKKQGGSWHPHSKYPDTDFREYQGGEFVKVNQLTPPPEYTDHSNWIRYEGPGIESDKVAYRVYLDWRNGFDIFGKLRGEPVLQQVGIDGYQSYHTMQDWGMDILKVGNSLGAGGYGLWHSEKLFPVGDVNRRTVSITEDGPLYSSFRINYDGWESPLGQQNYSAHIAMSAGSRLAKVSLDFEKPVPALAIGMVKHQNSQFIQGNLDITGKAYSYIASWGKQALDGSHLGMAVFFRKENVTQLSQDQHNYLAIVSPKGNPTDSAPQAQSLEYYMTAVWEPESGISTLEAFTQYLDREAERLTVTPRVRLKTQRSLQAKSNIVEAEDALFWSLMLADSEIKRKGNTYSYEGWDVHRKRSPKFEYDIVGLYPFALYQLGVVTEQQKLIDVLKTVTGSFITQEGNIKRYNKSNYNIDSVAPGRAVLALYQMTGEEKYRKAADLLREQMAEHPKTTEGAFWHKKKYTHQLWLDGVYMGMPFLAEYSNLFENGHSLDEVVNEFVLTRKYLRDEETGLYFHGWDEARQQSWANPETGLSPEFWARGVGWFAMALVDVLELLPADREDLRRPLLEMTAELAQALVEVQDPETGTWWQILDKPDEFGNYRESSATAMFVYFLAKSVERNYLPIAYQTVALKAYKGMIDEFVLVHEDGFISMTNQCYVAGLGFGRDGSYQYYMNEPVWKNDPKGNVPFILSGLAIYEMLSD